MSIFIDQSIRSSVGGYTKDKFVSGRSGFDVELNGRVLKFHDHFREFLCKYGALGYYERNRRDNLLEVAGLTLKKIYNYIYYKLILLMYVHTALKL